MTHSPEVKLNTWHTKASGRIPVRYLIYFLAKLGLITPEGWSCAYKAITKKHLSYANYEIHE
jgi:hypothetical protein